MPHEEGHTFSFQDNWDDQFGGHDPILVNTIENTYQGVSQQAVVNMLNEHPYITLDNYSQILSGSGILGEYTIGGSENFGDSIIEDMYEDSGFTPEEAEDASDALNDALTPGSNYMGGTQTLGQGLGLGGLDWESMQDMNANQIFNHLQDKGLIDEGEEFDAQWEEKIATIPKFNPFSQEDLGYAQAGIGLDAYGLQQDILRAQEDYTTIQSRGVQDRARAQRLTNEDIQRSQARLGLDLKDAGEAARSDIYGLQAQGAQQRRQGMFGKGLGGGMEALQSSDISRGMQLSGRGRMQSLAGTARGLREGAFDTQEALRRSFFDTARGIDQDIEDAATLRDRAVADATTDLYGEGGTGMDNLGQGGIYGQYGTMGEAQYNLQQQAIDDWESQIPQWLLDVMDE